METNQKPTTNVIFKYEEKRRLDQFANILETIAVKLREEQAFEFVQGDQSYEIRPNAVITSEIKYTTKGKKHSFEIEMEWIEGETTDQIEIR